VGVLPTGWLEMGVVSVSLGHVSSRGVPILQGRSALPFNTFRASPAGLFGWWVGCGSERIWAVTQFGPARLSGASSGTTHFFLSRDAWRLYGPSN
jgi:hypothetical protein